MLPSDPPDRQARGPAALSATRAAAAVSVTGAAAAVSLTRATAARSVAAVSAAASVLLAACGLGFEDPTLDPLADPFVRYPYVQAVSDSSAWVVWNTRRATSDTLLYWVEGSFSPDPGTEGIAVPDTVRIPAEPDSIPDGPGPDLDMPGAGYRHLARIDGLPPATGVGFRVVVGVSDSVRAAAEAARDGGEPLGNGGDPPLDRGGDQTSDASDAAGEADDADEAEPRLEPVVTEAHEFRTAPLPGEPTDVTALFFGDSGSGTEDQLALASAMLEVARERGATVALHTGDVAYPDGTWADFTLRHFGVYRELLTGIPFYPTVGNHDVRTRAGLPYRRAFVLPGRGPDADRLYYSFDWGAIHFVGLDSTGEHDQDSESNLRDRGAQYEWLQEDLALAATDPAIRWIVIYFHHPPYSSASGLVGHASDRQIRNVLAPLVDRFGVDLVVAGHDHHYERSFPLRNNTVDTETPGTVYMVTGGGGGRLDWRNVQSRWFTNRAAFEHHFLVVEMVGDRLIVEAIGQDGGVLDAFEVEPVPPAADDAPGSDGGRGAERP